MHRFPILKGISGDQKVAKVLGVGLDKRQIIVLVGALFAFWLLYKQLSRLLPMTTAQAFVAFAPLALLAIVVAFVTHDGRHVDWWVLKKTENRMKPRVLKWIKKRPGGKNKKPLGSRYRRPCRPSASSGRCCAPTTDATSSPSRHVPSP